MPGCISLSAIHSSNAGTCTLIMVVS